MSIRDVCAYAMEFISQSMEYSKHSPRILLENVSIVTVSLIEETP